MSDVLWRWSPTFAVFAVSALFAVIGVLLGWWSVLFLAAASVAVARPRGSVR